MLCRLKQAEQELQGMSDVPEVGKPSQAADHIKRCCKAVDDRFTVLIQKEGGRMICD